MYGGDIWDDDYDWTETALRHYNSGYQEQLQSNEQWEFVEEPRVASLLNQHVEDEARHRTPVDDLVHVNVETDAGVYDFV